MGEPETVTTCSRHPKVVTNLRCASCGIPICPRCLVQTPVGAKCRACATGASAGLFRASPAQAMLASAVGLAAGAVAGLAAQFNLGFFSLFLALVYGGFAGEMILRASGRKRGVRMEIIAGVTMVAGSVVARLLAAPSIASMGGAHPPLGILNVLAGLVVPSPIPLLTLVIAIAAAVSRIRYI